MSNFYVGQKVMWAGPTQRLGPVYFEEAGDRLAAGAVYEVSWIGMFKFSGGELPALRLKNHFRALRRVVFPHTIHRNVPYGQRYFRPLESKSIELFRAIAADPGKFDFKEPKKEKIKE